MLTVLLHSQSKNKRKLFLSISLFVLIFGIAVFGFHAWQGSAQTTDYEGSADELEEEINAKKQEIDKIDTRIKAYRAEIQAKQAEAATLKSQISILEQQLSATELEIEKLGIRTNQIELEIQANKLEIIKLEEQQEIVKGQIAEYLRAIYQEDDKSYFEIVVMEDNISDFFTHISQLESIEKNLKLDLEHLEMVEGKLHTEQSNLLSRKNNLVAIKRKLEEEQAKLEAQQFAKDSLLTQTRNSELQYQNLIAQERSLQNSIDSEIKNLEEELRRKLAESDQLGDVSKYGLIWPVPSRYITADFHDPNYPFRNVFEHPAIDIRAPQGTAVRAAASGYVARAKNAGLGYSYIMLVHADGISTVYGHVSQINVQEDTYVLQGDVIGLSGGMPGTPGAGRLTTGPHMHFEVRKNGFPVDPKQFLP